MKENRSASDTAPHARGDAPASGITLVSYLLGGLAFWGGVGWVVDRALGFSTLFLPIGLVVGLVGAIYLIYVQHVRS